MPKQIANASFDSQREANRKARLRFFRVAGRKDGVVFGCKDGGKGSCFPIRGKVHALSRRPGNRIYPAIHENNNLVLLWALPTAFLGGNPGHRTVWPVSLRVE